MSCALTPAEVARSGIQTAFFTQLGPLESVPRSKFNHWSLEFEGGALFWHSNGPAEESGQRRT